MFSDVRQAMKNAMLAFALIALVFLVFGPIIGIRETPTQRRSRIVGEEHERRQQEYRAQSEREAKRSQDQIERARKELFGDR